MRYKKIRGGEFTTNIEYENVLDREEGKNRILTNVTLINMGLEKIHIIINNGDEIPLDVGESITLGDLVINSILVVEKGSTVRYMGVE